MDYKELTIAVISYGIDDALAETLRHFCELEAEDTLEVLVIDCGFTKNSNENYNDLPRAVRVVNCGNSVWKDAVSIALNEAKGRYFKILRSIDSLNIRCLEEFIEYLVKADADLILSPYIELEAGSGAIVGQMCDYSGILRRGVNSRIDEFRALFDAYSMTVKTELLRDTNAFAGTCFYNGMEFAAKAAENCCTVSYFDRAFYYKEYTNYYFEAGIEWIYEHLEEHGNILIDSLKSFSGSIDVNHSSKIFVDAAYLQYLSYMSMMGYKNCKKKILDFDSSLKLANSTVYDSISVHQPISFWRNNGFMAYHALAVYKTMLDRKKKRNLFKEGKYAQDKHRCNLL